MHLLSTLQGVERGNVVLIRDSVLGFTMERYLRKHKTMIMLPLLWVVATCVNSTKAYHIDDTAYLEIAKAIQQDPLHSMSARINWLNSAEPIHRLNQPHLFFFLMAFTMSVFGGSEIVLHLLLSIFSLAAIIFFYLLARLYCPKHALYLTAIFGLGPAFIPSQNVMVDIPLVSCWLVFFWALLEPNFKKQPARYCVAAWMAAVACLIKYTSLILIPILFVAVALRKRWKLLWNLAMPIMVLLGWSISNYLDYGGIHLLNREMPGYGIDRLFIRTGAWIICLGAISPMAIVFIPFLVHDKQRRYLFLTCVVIMTAVFIMGLVILQEPLNHSLLRAIFFATGLLLSVLTVSGLLKRLKTYFAGEKREDKVASALLLFWFLAAGAFIILFSPAIAVRHLILILPVVLLVMGRTVLQRVTQKWQRLGLVVNLLFGLLLGISDWAYADVYRAYAPRIATKLGQSSTIWYVGHWGWKWYAAKSGMQEYDYKLSHPQKGDFLVMPELVDKQMMAAEHQLSLRQFDEVVVESSAATFFRVGPRGGYYASSIRRLPWILSSGAVETFKIFQFK